MASSSTTTTTMATAEPPPPVAEVSFPIKNRSELMDPFKFLEHGGLPVYILSFLGGTTTTGKSTNHQNDSNDEGFPSPPSSMMTLKDAYNLYCQLSAVSKLWRGICHDYFGSICGPLYVLVEEDALSLAGTRTPVAVRTSKRMEWMMALHLPLGYLNIQNLAVVETMLQVATLVEQCDTAQHLTTVKTHVKNHDPTTTRTDLPTYTAGLRRLHESLAVHCPNLQSLSLVIPCISNHNVTTDENTNTANANATQGDNATDNTTTNNNNNPHANNPLFALPSIRQLELFLHRKQHSTTPPRLDAVSHLVSHLPCLEKVWIKLWSRWGHYNHHELPLRLLLHRDMEFAPYHMVPRIFLNPPRMFFMDNHNNNQNQNNRPVVGNPVPPNLRAAVGRAVNNNNDDDDDDDSSAASTASDLPQLVPRPLFSSSSEEEDSDDDNDNDDEEDNDNNHNETEAQRQQRLIDRILEDNRRQDVAVATNQNQQHQQQREQQRERERQENRHIPIFEAHQRAVAQYIEAQRTNDQNHPAIIHENNIQRNRALFDLLRNNNNNNNNHIADLLNNDALNDFRRNIGRHVGLAQEEEQAQQQNANNNGAPVQGENAEPGPNDDDDEVMDVNEEEAPALIPVHPNNNGDAMERMNHAVAAMNRSVEAMNNTVQDLNMNMATLNHNVNAMNHSVAAMNDTVAEMNRSLRRLLGPPPPLMLENGPAGPPPLVLRPRAAAAVRAAGIDIDIHNNNNNNATTNHADNDNARGNDNDDDEFADLPHLEGDTTDEENGGATNNNNNGGPRPGQELQANAQRALAALLRPNDMPFPPLLAPPQLPPPPPIVPPPAEGIEALHARLAQIVGRPPEFRRLLPEPPALIDRPRAHALLRSDDEEDDDDDDDDASSEPMLMDRENSSSSEEEDDDDDDDDDASTDSDSSGPPPLIRRENLGWSSSSDDDDSDDEDDGDEDTNDEEVSRSNLRLAIKSKSLQYLSVDKGIWVRCECPLLQKLAATSGGRFYGRRNAHVGGTLPLLNPAQYATISSRLQGPTGVLRVTAGEVTFRGFAVPATCEMTFSGFGALVGRGYGSPSRLSYERYNRLCVALKNDQLWK